MLSTCPYHLEVFDDAFPERCPRCRRERITVVVGGRGPVTPIVREAMENAGARLVKERGRVVEIPGYAPSEVVYMAFETVGRVGDAFPRDGNLGSCWSYSEAFDALERARLWERPKQVGWMLGAAAK